MAETGTYAYVSHNKGREILVLRLDPASGALTPVQQVAVTGHAMPMAVSPDRRFLFVALRSLPYSVASFAIDPLSGKLTHLANAPLPDSMSYISTDRTGRYLLATAISDDRSKPRKALISVSSIGPNGFVQPAHQIMRTGPKAHCILADPSNNYVLVALCDADEIMRLVFDAATGMYSPNTLTPVRTKPHSGPRQFLFHPNYRFFYVLSEPDASVYAFRYDASAGALTELQTLSALPPDFGDKHPEGAGIDITPDGRFLYTSERSSNTLAAFKIDLASGILSPVGHFPTEDRPHGFSIDPHGRCLLAAGENSSRMTSYAIDGETGNLTKLKEYPLGKGPNCVKILNLP